MHSHRSSPNIAFCLSKQLGWLLLAWCLLFVPPASNSEEPFSEYNIKAGMILNLTKFVFWPDEKLGETDKPVIIGIYGKDPFGPVLPNIAKLQEVNGHRMVVRQLIKVEEISNCHVVYCSGSAQETDKLLTAAKDAKVVFVSDTDNFTKAGGHICLFMQDKKVRFEINLAAFERSGLKMHSQVLKLATRVTRDGKDANK